MMVAKAKGLNMNIVKTKAAYVCPISDTIEEDGNNPILWTSCHKLQHEKTM